MLVHKAYRQNLERREAAGTKRLGLGLASGSPRRALNSEGRPGVKGVGGVKVTAAEVRLNVATSHLRRQGRATRE
jgi:hypothetical protein